MTTTELQEKLNTLIHNARELEHQAVALAEAQANTYSKISEVCAELAKNITVEKSETTTSPIATITTTPTAPLTTTPTTTAHKRSRRRKGSIAKDVTEALKSSKRAVSAAELAEQTGHSRAQVTSALHGLFRQHQKMFARPKPGLWELRASA